MAALTVTAAITEILLLWGIENPAAAASSSTARAYNDLNRALQLLWANAENLNYFNQATIQATLLANVASLTLPTNIQEIIGPVRLDSTKQPMQPIATRFEAENYAAVYLGGQAPGAVPLAYYLQTEFNTTTDAAEALALTLFPVPPPTMNTVIDLDVVTNAPSYGPSDFTAGTNIPIPHQYGESILLPLCRHAGMSHYLFLEAESRGVMIEAEYREAKRLLGIVEPDVDEVRPEVKVSDFVEFKPIPPLSQRKKA